MIVRLTFISFLPQNVEQAKRIYNEQVVPVVRKQKGNLDCRLLEPTEKGDEYISMTTWEPNLMPMPITAAVHTGTWLKK